MTDRQLGRLARVELRNVWINEAVSFTPWLARPESIDLLGEALGIELKLEAREQAVGPFRADILCKEIRTDRWVLIENQLERTDHVHLGQLLTYAAGLEAVSIVWIAARFTDEHRAALDWLNRITEPDFRFFGVEVELWRIGDSLAAPKFNIVSKPNDWSHSVAEAARAIDDDARVKQREYWTALNSILDASSGPISGNIKAQAKSWMTFPIGRSNFSLASVRSPRKNQVRAELYIKGEFAKAFFGSLKAQKNEIERELGYQLEWEELPKGNDCRIASYLREVDTEDKTNWQTQHEWLAKRLNELHTVFAARVRTKHDRAV